MKGGSGGFADHVLAAKRIGCTQITLRIIAPFAVNDDLPQVPGFEVLEWIRNNPDYARTPVIVFSSSTREDDRVRAKELGADDFVAKPSSGLKFGEVVEGLQQKWLGWGG